MFAALPSLAALCLSLLCQPSRGQTTTATLLGTAVDSSGAVVVGVTVAATNLATNARREATTDQDGNYSIPSLPAGEYRVTATHEGFQAQRVDRVTLQVEQSARVDFTLKVGNVTINRRASDPGPPNSTPTDAFVSDGFHPNTVLQGIFANIGLQAFDSGYNAGVS